MSLLNLNDLSTSRINSNRLLHEAELLNLKVNEYRKTLSLGFSTTKNDSLNSSIRRARLTSNPKKEYTSLNSSISNTFSPITMIPSTERYKMSESKLLNIKQQYDNQIKSLYSNFKSSLSKIEELYSSSQSDIPLIKQILNDDLFYEREHQIDNLIEEIAELKEEYNSQNQHKPQSNELIQRQIDSLKENYEREIQKVTNESKYIIDKMKKDAFSQNTLIQKYVEELSFIQNDNKEYKIEIERLQKMIHEIEKEYQNISNQYESLQNNYNDIKEQLFDSTIKAKQIADDNNILKGMLDQYENDMKATNEKYSLYQFEKDSHNDLMISYEKQQQSKYDSFDIAIVNLKESNCKLEDELKCEREKLCLSKQSYNKLYEEMQEKVKLLSTEWEKKHKEEQTDYERLISEIEYKNKEQMNEIINENKSMIEEKKKEIEQYKQSIEVLQAIQKDSIRISEHEAKVNEEIDIIKQRHENEKVFIDEENKIKIGNLEKEKKTEYDTAIDIVNLKVKQIEKENFELKGNIAQLKEQISEEKEKNDKHNKDILYLNSTIDAKHKEINELNNTIQSKQKEISDNKNDIQDKLKEITYLNEQYALSKEIITKKNDEIEKNKNQIEDKEKQIKELENDKAKERTININLKKEIQDLVLNIRDLELKVKTSAETNSVLFSQLNETIQIRDKLIESLSQIKSELELIKKYALQSIQNTKNDIWNVVEGLNNKLQHYDTKKLNQIKDLEAQFEKHYTEQYRQNEKLKHDNERLIDIQQQDSYKLNDLINQLNEKENQISKLQSTLSKTTDEMNKKVAEIDNLKSNPKEFSKKMESKIKELRGKVQKMKKRYQSKLNDIKSDIDNLQQTHKSEVTQASKTQSASLQNVIKALKNESFLQSDSLQKLKTLNQALTIDVENKGDELENTKKEYNKLVNLKDKKIKSLQSIISQSFNTYSNGLSSLKTSQKLNDDVRNLIRKAKEDEAFNENS